MDFVRESYYEESCVLNEYLLFHYGTPSAILPYSFGPSDALNFHTRCVDLLVKHASLKKHSQALDLGCAVGRSTFELARHYDRVMGIDYSVQFIEKANELKCFGVTEFERTSEGILTEKFTAEISDEIDRTRVNFIQGDACDLPTALGGFDAVLLANLIDRLPKPKACIKFLSHLVNKHGIALITSPYTWKDDYTPKERWLGGFVEDNKPVKSKETLQKLLADDFKMLDCLDLPFIIREHSRKFQWSVAQATVWKRL